MGSWHWKQARLCALSASLHHRPRVQDQQPRPRGGFRGSLGASPSTLDPPQGLSCRAKRSEDHGALPSQDVLLYTFLSRLGLDQERLHHCELSTAA